MYSINPLKRYDIPASMMIKQRDKPVLTIIWLYLAIFTFVLGGVRLYFTQYYHKWVAEKILLAYLPTGLPPSKLLIRIKK